MNEQTEPLAGYGTHLRRSRDLLLIEMDEARVGQQMAEHANDRSVARVEQLEALLKEVRLYQFTGYEDWLKRRDQALHHKSR